MEFTQYVRRPFQVEAVEITAENMKEVAELIGKIRKEAGITFIVLDRRLIPNVTRAYVGWYLTCFGEEYRCYAPKVFKKLFIAHKPVILFSFPDGEQEDEIEIVGPGVAE